MTRGTTGVGCGLPDVCGVCPHGYSNVVYMRICTYIGDNISLQLHCSVLFWNDLADLLFVLFHAFGHLKERP